jgi:hypothetical protein
MQNTLTRDTEGKWKNLIQNQVLKGGVRSGFSAVAVNLITGLCHQKISQAREPQVVTGARSEDSEPIYPGINLPRENLFRILARIERGLQLK